MIRSPASLIVAATASLFVAVLHCTAGLSGEWPQILGKDRNGIAKDETLPDQWPEAGPKLVWKHGVGDGFASVAVADGKTIVFHRIEDKEIVEALDATTGESIWKTAYPTRYASSIAEDDGPRATPVIDDDTVYVFGAQGRLTALSLKDGETRWHRNTHQDFEALEGYFGAGSSPLVEDGKVLVNVGGRNAGIVAFSSESGETLWQATNERASYSSPVAVTVDGVRHTIFITRLNVLSLDPKTGDVRFQFPFGMRGPTVNAANPLVLGDKLFVSASYGVGAKLAQIKPEGAEVLWSRNDVMSSQYTTCVEVDGLLYGVDGRQDIGVARLRCFDPHTAKVLWTKEHFGMATLIAAGDKLLIMKTDGELVLAEASPKGFKQLDSAQLFDGITRALPALSEGRFYVRDTDTLKCFEVGR